MKTLHNPLLWLAFLALAFLIWCSGCARFSTTQIDERSNGKETTKITTRAAAWTCFSARSALANFKAAQTEKTQGASVGALTQETTTTNFAANAAAALNLIKELKTP